MPVFSESNLFGMTIRESANDGSDFTNPDADYRRLFLGEDGLLHLKDSAGAVTTIGGITRSTLGTTSAGASFATTRGTYIKKVTLATAGLLASVHAFVKGDASNWQGVAAGVLSDNSGTPLRVIASGNVVRKESDGSALSNIIFSTTVRDLATPIGAWLTAGDYWLAVLLHAGADSRIQLAYNAGTGTDRKNSAQGLADEAVATYGSSDTNDYCIYADILR